MILAKTNRIIRIVGTLLLLRISALAQTDIGTSSHWYNRANFNPASIARPDYVYLFSNVRNQWVGVDGAPKVYSFMASGYSDKHNSAVGISMIRDEIGLTKVLNPTLQFAHLIGLSENMKLSLGLSFGAYLRNINTSAYEAETAIDLTLNNSEDRYSSPDANLGLELQSKHLIFGASTTHLFALWNPDNDFLISNHRYAYLMYKNNDLEYCNFIAGIQASNRNNLTVVEATGILRIKKPTGLQKGPRELFDIGLTVRTVKQLTFITGINITRNMRVGYCYDFNFGISNSGYATHEIVFEYRIPLNVIIDNGYPWYD